jgi:hypothetical protein
MSNFFSCIVTRKADVLFCELDAHDEVVYRSGLSDDLTQFLRVVYDPTDGYFVDSGTIPEWYERNAALIERNVHQIYRQLVPFWNVLDRAYQVADSAFMVAVGDARDAFDTYKVSRRVERFSTGVLQSDEEDECVLQGFEGFVGAEGSAYERFEHAKEKELEKYMRKVAFVKGYLPRRDG